MRGLLIPSHVNSPQFRGEFRGVESRVELTDGLVAFFKDLWRKGANARIGQKSKGWGNSHLCNPKQRCASCESCFPRQAEGQAVLYVPLGVGWPGGGGVPMGQYPAQLDQWEATAVASAA